jgi:CheY-like chemotaxis protein
MAAANDDEQPEAETGCLSGLRVLVVEDSWHVATAIESLLRSFGAEVAGPVEAPQMPNGCSPSGLLMSRSSISIFAAASWPTISLIN